MYKTSLLPSTSEQLKINICLFSYSEKGEGEVKGKATRIKFFVLH